MSYSATELGVHTFTRDIRLTVHTFQVYYYGSLDSCIIPDWHCLILIANTSYFLFHFYKFDVDDYQTNKVTYDQQTTSVRN